MADSDSAISHDPDAPGHIRVFEVEDGRKLRGGRVFADFAPGFADGMRTDRDGNLWSSSGWAGAGTDGVRCFGPDGELIGRIVLPEPCSNLQPVPVFAVRGGYGQPKSLTFGPATPGCGNRRVLHQEYSSRRPGKRKTVSTASSQFREIRSAL